jgi:hypothetical protein
LTGFSLSIPYFVKIFNKNPLSPADKNMKMSNCSEPSDISKICLKMQAFYTYFMRYRLALNSYKILIYLLTLILLNVNINNIKERVYMKERKAQEWIYNLSDEDITFIKNFILSSGSLKEVARLYEITYPTVRLRLDRLIKKMQLNEQIENDSYILLIKKMVIDDQLDFDTAKILINKYREQKED